MAEPLGGVEPSRAQLGHWAVPLKGILGVPAILSYLTFQSLDTMMYSTARSPKQLGQASLGLNL